MNQAETFNGVRQAYLSYINADEFPEIEQYIKRSFRWRCILAVVLFLIFLPLLPISIWIVIAAVRRRSKMRAQYEPAKALAEHAVPILGFPIMMNGGLFTGEIEAAPALVLGTFDVNADVEKLKTLYMLIGAMLDEGPENEAIAELRKIMEDDDYVENRRRPIPPGITAGVQVIAFDIGIEHALLPKSLPENPYIVCMATPGSQGIIRQVPDNRVPPPSEMPTLTELQADDREMEEAVAKARSTLDTFWATLDAPTNGESAFALKVRIAQGNQGEHLWAVDIKRSDLGIEGTIDNDPAVIQNVKCGERILISEEAITDWSYMLDGKAHGKYTTRVLLDRMSPEEAGPIRSVLA